MNTSWYPGPCCMPGPTMPEHHPEMRPFPSLRHRPPSRLEVDSLGRYLSLNSVMDGGLARAPHRLVYKGYLSVSLITTQAILDNVCDILASFPEQVRAESSW